VPLVHACAAEGCETWTMGKFCLEHERPNEEPLVAVDVDARGPTNTGGIEARDSPRWSNT
jgi:hypothetical protein